MKNTHNGKHGVIARSAKRDEAIPWLGGGDCFAKIVRNDNNYNDKEVYDNDRQIETDQRNGRG
jgi:hypothetical protein